MADQRASDADRERAFEQLRRAGGDGRLTVDELDERLEQAHDARTLTALDALLADVSGDAGPGEIARHRTREAPLVVRPGPGGTRWVLSIMSGATRSGGWLVSPRCTVLNIMGGSDIDLNDAEFAGDVVHMTIFTLMGGADVYVPEHLRTEISDIGIMGGNDVQRAERGAERSDGPLLRLRLISIMGGTNVRRGRKLSRAERREQRKARKAESAATLPEPPEPPRLPGS